MNVVLRVNKQKMKMRLISFFLILFFSISCVEREDDLISQDCETDCTEIIGKLMTDNANTPIANRKVTVIWDNTYFTSGVVRTKATTRTDADGNFNLKFYIRDDELEEGLHRMYYDKLNETVFLRADLNNISIYPTVRDTIFLRNHNIPKKAYLKLNLLNLEDIKEGDNFWTSFRYISPEGYSQSINGLVRGWNNQYESTQLIEIAGNQALALEITRNKDGIITRDNDTLFINAGETLDYTIDFNN
ncbi:hypothetical protein [Leeuwenhoekiella nanhaiensis]|uniref:Carboxypeptidase regulatory-like domain-containing protein n=1 Tax=Leeuwenhoekiella nanhaiensis TaxID=1655491 RepID=A0A2G1VUE8_9FLAO|nr:hypothetical protein [Leeuwenhoekiella nanhaiensis]PHQ30413.1 hypothetical protein CJ305_05495 [Leeuwenhoekiella nanhaiensis]